MDYKKETEVLLNSLKVEGHNRQMIEEKLGYGANGIDQSLSRGGSEKMYKAIALYTEYVKFEKLKNSINTGLAMITIPMQAFMDLTESNRKLTESNWQLSNKINSSGSGPVSKLSVAKEKGGRHLVQQESSLDKSKIHSPSKKGKQKGIST